MKHFKFLSLLFVALVATTAFFACGDDDDDSTGGNSGLIGAWIDSDQREILVLQSGGKGYWASVRHLDDAEEFTWSTSGDILTLKYAAEDYGYSYAEEEIDRYRYVLSGDKLTLSDVDGGYSYSSGGFSEVYTRYELNK
ncbi:MAG: hypothetical protein J5486_02140 [Bacteroidaceae bacterium]|nr:hypothetical protein [Bacteroidaceae bacterium]